LDDFISLFSRLPAAQRARIDTRFLTTLAHGIHMLAYVAPSDRALRQLSSNAARVSGVAARDSYCIGISSAWLKPPCEIPMLRRSSTHWPNWYGARRSSSAIPNSALLPRLVVWRQLGAAPGSVNSYECLVASKNRAFGQKSGPRSAF